MTTRPWFTAASPVSTLRSVDLPAPLEPITVTNWPAGMERSSPRRCRRLHRRAAVEGHGDIRDLDHRRPRLAIMARSGLRAPGRISATATSTAVTRLRSDAFEAEERGIERQRHGQPVDHRAGDAAEDPDRQRLRAKDRFAHDDRGQPRRRSCRCRWSRRQSRSSGRTGAPANATRALLIAIPT